jgi:plasmid stability protein
MGTKTKYGRPTEMLAVRVPADLHDALKAEASRKGKPKSETAVDILAAALEPEKQSAFE